ncbi:class I SAM-dependent methyltransferase [Amycolatopsis carbonis]|uniref:Class I SAM-dependent methyltransferase n=1 Tax=Amycolatopsis carbonis TaxID=715471 RepID=A0A9Y2IFX3_9PSEU|nr:class I SAM-dependent methyltransferase [Amycolatopsis sp. 2-15]WIX79610.1 class I SAM-dependent methyltransferase [Amycolatopsis sp. 2-15]
MLSDDEAAELYDVLNTWGDFPADHFYDALVERAPNVLDVGCGTGGMLHHARDRGHRGRLVGLDPDRAALTRARRRTDVEWWEGTAAALSAEAEFDLVTMTGHAFQCLTADEDLRCSLSAIRRALRPGGRFAFETRHPRAKAWEDWTPAHPVTVSRPRPLRLWHEVESVVGDVVSFTEAVADPEGTVLRVDRAALRFLGPDELDEFLTVAGFVVEERFGDWERGPLTEQSREIVTIASAVRQPQDRAAQAAPAPKP